MSKPLLDSLSLSVLLIAKEKAEAKMMKAIEASPAPRERSEDQQSIINGLVDNYQKASREYRDASRAIFWERHEAGAQKTREAYPHIFKQGA